MEWVETTGRTVAEAIEQALDRLGVAESDAEVVILEEPKTSMFGLRKTTARVRARVRPVQARAKRPTRRASGGDGKQRRAGSSPGGRSEGSGRGGRRPGRSDRGPSEKSNTSERQGGSTQPKSGSKPGGRQSGGGAVAGDGSSEPRPESDRPAGQRSRRGRGRSGAPRSGTEEVSGGRDKVATEEEEMSIETQAQQAEEFVRGVVERFGLDARTTSEIGEDTVRIDVSGENLGLLIGPRGATADALQELTRTAVQHRADEYGVRITVDVGGYRVRRAAALQQFAQRVAADVIESGEPQALDPMSAADRKVVHDAVNEIDGVRTTSEGEDPRRYVVIHTAGGSDLDTVASTSSTTDEPGTEDSAAD